MTLDPGEQKKRKREIGVAIVRVQLKKKIHFMINGQVSFVHIHVDKKPHASNYTHICTYTCSVKILLYNLRKEERSRFSSPSNTLCHTPQDYYKPTPVLENPLKYKELCKYDFQVTNVWNSYSQISIGYYGFIVLLLSTFFFFSFFFARRVRCRK